MGFLSGAYGKLLAGKRVRQIQYELTSVQQQATRITRQIGNMERMFSARERMNSMMMRNMQAYQMQQLQGYMAPFNAQGIGQQDKMDAYQAYQTAHWQMQQQMMYQQEYFAQQMEDMRNAMLEPLKDIENELELRKQSLESQLKLAEAQLQAKEKEEDAGVKQLVPKYTSQG